MNTAQKKQIESFEIYLADKQFTLHNIRKYTNRIIKLVQWATAENLQQITYPDLLSYIRYLQSQNENATLINARLLAIRHYFDYEIFSRNYLFNQIINYNPASNLQLKGTKSKIIFDYLKRSELESLYDNYNGKEKIMLGFIIYQGLKAAELERVERIHINLKAGTIYVPASKKAGSRVLKLDAAQLYELLQEKTENENNLVIGKSLNNRILALMKNLKKLTPIAIGTKIRNAHQLRASVIVDWLKTEGLRQAQYKAGHTTIAATEKYQPLNIEGLQQQVNLFFPLK